MAEKCRFFGGHFLKMAHSLDKFDCIIKFEIHISLPISSEKINLNSRINFTETMSKMYFSVTKMSFSGGIGTPGSENRYNSFPSTGEYV